MLLRQHYPLAAPTATVARWTRTSGGEALPVSLEAVKVFTARPVNDTAWDDELTTFIRVAQAAVENECKLLLTPCVWSGTLPNLTERIRIIRRPFVEVDSFQYVDASTGTITTIDPTLYQTQYEPQDIGMIYLGQDLSWPQVASRRDAVRLSVKAGYAVDDTDIAAGYPEMPEEIRHAVLMTIASLEKARGDTEASTGNVTVYAMKASKGGGLVPAEAKNLLFPYIYRTVTFA